MMKEEQTRNMVAIKVSMRDTVKDNPDMASFYAKKSCKRCYGKGIITRNLVRQIGLSEGWADQKEICQCVDKGIDKEARAAVS